MHRKHDPAVVVVAGVGVVVVACAAVTGGGV